MHRTKWLLTLLPTLPGAGRRLPSDPNVVPPRRAEAAAHTGECLICCVGVVKKPQVRFRAMDPTWQCTLLVSQLGLTADGDSSHLSLSQEQFAVTCTGELWYRYCRERLHADAVVHLQARAVQRPRYRPDHGSYVYETELQVTPQCGSIAVVRR